MRLCKGIFLPCCARVETLFFEPTFVKGVDGFAVVSMPSLEGSLKQYTGTPPVLDRFKKWFLHGTNGEFKIFLLIAGRFKRNRGDRQENKRQGV